MTAIAGKSGRVQYGGGKVLRINSWNIDIDTNLPEVTAWSTGTDQWRQYIGGLSGAAGNISGFYDVEGSTGQEDMQTATLTPSTGQAILYVDAGSVGSNFRGSILFERMGVNVDIDDVATVDYGYRFTGTVTYSTAT